MESYALKPNQQGRGQKMFKSTKSNFVNKIADFSIVRRSTVILKEKLIIKERVFQVTRAVSQWRTLPNKILDIYGSATGIHCGSFHISIREDDWTIKGDFTCIFFVL